MPSLPPRPCTTARCSSMATKGAKCAEHQPEGWSRWANNQDKKRYKGGWAKIRKVALRRDNYLCQNHLSKGIYKSGNEVDHIIPKSQGGTDNLDNLQTLCTNCHSEKTIKERN